MFNDNTFGASLGTIPEIDDRTLLSHRFRDFSHRRHSRAEERELLEDRDAMDSHRLARGFLFSIRNYQLIESKLYVQRLAGNLRSI